MGPEETKDPILFMNGIELGPISEIRTINETPVAFDENHERYIGVDLSNGQDFTFTGSFTPKYPHISRKQFIHRLQKLGYSKKEAKRIAWETQKNKRTSYGFIILLYTVGALPHPKNRVWSI